MPGEFSHTVPSQLRNNILLANFEDYAAQAMKNAFT
jgi:hypothetical protein